MKDAMCGSWICICRHTACKQGHLWPGEKKRNERMCIKYEQYTHVAVYALRKNGINKQEAEEMKPIQ